jgi:arylsulfatase A-like enzyme
MPRHLTLAASVLLTLAAARLAAAPPQPNVLIILTDDQGHGDLGCHGNPKIKTPNLDKFAAQSVKMDSFYVCPVCSPTRSGLMTGRYNYRLGVVDTALGRSMMDPKEITLAQMLGDGGYRTGIFGKWHLGDNYPLRPIDRGFQEALVLKGGGIKQPSDPPDGSGYFDPVLEHNGKSEKTKGYCTDVFTDAALKFIDKKSDKPFFAYVAFNCPHTPLNEVPEKYLEPYKKINLGADEFPKVGHPIGKVNEDVTARIYAMETNIDDNVGRLLARLDELKIADNTIVIFLSDNGPQQPRYNSGLLDLKTSVHEGGIRVPCYWRWPGHFIAGHKVDRIAAHIDIAPTLVELCRVQGPPKGTFDGRSLEPLLTHEKVDWPDRTLFVQWHRGETPELNRACAARTQKWKIAQPKGIQEGGSAPKDPVFELYDMENDPLELKNVAADHPDIVTKMRKDYEAWFKDVSSTRGYGPVRIHVGAPQENPSLLTRQDWRGPKSSWGADGLGFWEVTVARGGKYDVTLYYPKAAEDTTVEFKLGNVTRKQDVKAGSTQVTLQGIELTAGDGRIEATIEREKKTVGVHYVELKRVGD